MYIGVTGEPVCVRRAPDLAKLELQLQQVLQAGITSLAVVLKHAAIFPAHEEAVGDLARRMGFKQVRPRCLRYGPAQLGVSVRMQS